ncbi:MAG: MoxR family ATPase [Clostridia bacterium]|nr:MoxR family ATPase [Clostridia bacterium]
MEVLSRLMDKLVANIGKVIIGKEEVIRHVVITFLCQGHILIEDVPGMGKTMMVRSLARSLGCSFSRIQFTPDLMPSDVTGVNIFNQKTGEFNFYPGPIFTQMLLADEINRATPKTQASLLESMEERQVTMDGVSHELPRPFMLLATQNPLEYAGTFPLPEAQLDRFLIKTKLGYPSYEYELEILKRLVQYSSLEEIDQVIAIEEVFLMQQKVKEVYADEAILDYIVRLVGATRSHPEVLLGASPRGSISLLKTAKAWAALEGRDFVLPDDVKAMAIPTLAHRIMLRRDAFVKKIDHESLIREVMDTTPFKQ